MKRCLNNVLLALIICGIANAQNNSTKKEEPDDFYGKGGKKETVTTIFPGGETEETVRFFDPGGRVRQYKRTTTKKDGRTVEEHISYDCNGNKTDTELIMKDANGDIEYYRAEKHAGGKENEVIEGYLSEKNASGENEISKFNPKTGQYEKVRKSDPPPAKPTFDQNRFNCPVEKYKIEISAGYSHLIANFEPENEGLSGWGANAFYKFTPRWSAGLFASGHYKSPENQKFSMYFLHATLKYDFLNNERTQNRFNPYIAAGLGVSKYYTEFNIPGIPKFETSDKSFTPLFGAGVDMEITRKLFLEADASYVPTRFNDKTQHNIRLSVGVGMGVFKAMRQFPTGSN